MVRLSSLPALVTQKSKRRGRGLGSGSGAKSGRGTTRHQKARTNIPLFFEGGQNKMTKKFPLLRGKGRNKSIAVRPYEVNIEKLNIFKKNESITIERLIQAKIVPASAQKRGVKVLGRGALAVPLKVALPVSAIARKKIEDAGGTLLTS